MDAFLFLIWEESAYSHPRSVKISHRFNLPNTKPPQPFGQGGRSPLLSDCFITLAGDERLGQAGARKPSAADAYPSGHVS
jgi:hypothetical protein